MGKVSNAALSVIGDIKNLAGTSLNYEGRTALKSYRESRTTATKDSGKAPEPEIDDSSAKNSEIANEYADKAFETMNKAITVSAAQKKSIQEQKERAARKNKNTVGKDNIKTPNIVPVAQHAPTIKRLNKKKGRIVSHKGGTANVRE